MDHPLLRAWHEAATGHLPPAAQVWDAHTHTGAADPDGLTIDAAALLARLGAAGHAGAVMCTSADPEGYDAPNHRVLEDAGASEGRLIPFARIDPRRHGAAERAAEAIASGHGGLKLHPRSETFDLSHPGVDEVCGAASAARVPVLIHAGRGMPPLGEEVLRLADRHGGATLVLAHCAISDLAWIAPHAATRPRLAFDTAWWNPADHAALFAWVDASQILYASDTPYGDPLGSFGLTMRAAVQAGLSGAALTAVFGGNLRRVLDGDPPAAPLGVGVPGFVDPGLLRVASNLYAAIASAFAGRPGRQPIELALRAAEAAPTPHDRSYAAIRATLEAARRAEGADRLWLLITACSAAFTPAAGVPGD